jgi:hypothetical protein
MNLAESEESSSSLSLSRPSRPATSVPGVVDTSDLVAKKPLLRTRARAGAVTNDDEDVDSTGFAQKLLLAQFDGQRDDIGASFTILHGKIFRRSSNARKS